MPPKKQSDDEELDKLKKQFENYNIRPDSERRSDKALWKNAKTYDDVLKLNRQYLVKQINNTPYYDRPIDGTTMHIVPGLLRLHDYGLFTFDSQACQTNDPFLTECPCNECVDKAKVMEMPKPHIQRLRPYVQFLLPREDSRISEDGIKKFCKEMWTDGKFFTTIVKPLDYNGDKIHISTNLPDGDQPIHAQQYGATQKEAYAAPMETYTTLSPDNLEIFKHLKTDADVFPKLRPLLVKILAKSWSQQDLQYLVQQAAERAGLQPCFRMLPDEKACEKEHLERDKHFHNFVDDAKTKQDYGDRCICFLDRALTISILAETMKQKTRLEEFAKLKIHHVDGCTQHRMPAPVRGGIKVHYCSGVMHHGMGNESAKTPADLCLLANLVKSKEPEVD